MYFMGQVENEIRAKRRGQILKVALKLFAHHGYETTSISMIAKEAGISKGLMYNYFAGKKELLATLVFGFFEDLEKVGNQLLAQDLSPQKMLEEMVRGYVAQVKESIDHWKLLMALGFQPGVLDELQQEIETKTKQMFGDLTALFAAMEVDDPTMEALLFGSHLDGVFMHYLQAGEAYPIDEVMTAVINKYTFAVS